MASAIPAPAGGGFDVFNEGIISIKTKWLFSGSWEARAVPQQVAASTLGTGSLPGAFAEWGCLWG